MLDAKKLEAEIKRNIGHTMGAIDQKLVKLPQGSLWVWRGVLDIPKPTFKLPGFYLYLAKTIIGFLQATDLISEVIKIPALKCLYDPQQIGIDSETTIGAIWRLHDKGYVITSPAISPILSEIEPHFCRIAVQYTLVTPHDPNSVWDIYVDMDKPIESLEQEDIKPLAILEGYRQALPKLIPEAQHADLEAVGKGLAIIDLSEILNEDEDFVKTKP